MSDTPNCGDKLIFNKSDPETRAWTPNLPPNGTEVVFKSFDEIAYGYVNNYGREPGFYENRCYAFIEVPDENEIIRVSTVSLAALGNTTSIGRWTKYPKFLRKLPRNKYYPDDRVSFYEPISDSRVIGIIQNIDFYALEKYINNNYEGRPPCAYEIKSEDNRIYYHPDSKLYLEKCGNVWKYYNGSPITFNSIEEELEFFVRIGKYDDVRCPETGYFITNKASALRAIANGIADSFYKNGLIKFRDPKLGQRVAEFTLDKYGFYKR